jgi:hypothetical protein
MSAQTICVALSVRHDPVSATTSKQTNTFVVLIGLLRFMLPLYLKTLIIDEQKHDSFTIYLNAYNTTTILLA